MNRALRSALRAHLADHLDTTTKSLPTIEDWLAHISEQALEIASPHIDELIDDMVTPR